MSPWVIIYFLFVILEKAVELKYSCVRRFLMPTIEDCSLIVDVYVLTFVHMICTYAQVIFYPIAS